MPSPCRWIVVLAWLAPATVGPQTEPFMPATRTQEAVVLMLEFAERTGLSGKAPPQRYLWTDAFAVCNFLGLARATGDAQYTELALRLIDQVHHTLGRHRKDDTRTGWISGLDETEGEAHPTRGGLRIGKPLPERDPDEAYYERLEWDRDGQYFHYLTKWMHALVQTARSTGEASYSLWARELAETAYRAFTYFPPADRPRMYWKMSIDLDRALVPSMGQHDPLDGLISALELTETATELKDAAQGSGLADEIAGYRTMLDPGNLATTDPLGLGGLLTDAYRLQQLIQTQAAADTELLRALLAASLSGLQHFARGRELQAPADQRLAFREVGLAIGLHALRAMWQTSQHDGWASPSIRGQLQALMHFVPIGEQIEDFWRDPVNQSASTWQEHRDINAVMLATSLVPEGFLQMTSIGSETRR
jgi:hypothetical protein